MLVSCLVVLDVFLNPPDQHALVLLEADGCGFDDEGFRQLAGGVVRDGDHGCVGDSGVGEEVRFEFGGGDLEALVWVYALVLGQLCGCLIRGERGFLGLGMGKCTLTLINSFIRSTIQICSVPFGPLRTTASSPVRIQPSWKVSRFAWSLFR